LFDGEVDAQIVLCKQKHRATKKSEN